MNIFNRSFDLTKGIFGKNNRIILEELVYPQIPVFDILDEVIGTIRDMRADKFIQEKEFVEIEVRLESYNDYMDFHRETLNRSYELERKEFELIQFITNKIMIPIEKVGELDADSSKAKTYLEQIRAYQKILEKIIETRGKYFNDKTIDANSIEILNFSSYTDIGKVMSGRKK